MSEIYANNKMIFSGLGGPLGYALNLVRDDSNAIGFRSSECDLLNKKFTINYFTNLVKSINRGAGITYVHAAAKSGGSHLSEKIPASLFTENIEMAINALEACRISGIDRIILILSTSCYSSSIANPSEVDLHKFPVETNEFGYSYAKRMFEVLMRAYNKQYNMNISCVLVNGIIGSHMKFSDEHSILPAALIKKFVTNKSNLNTVELWGDGTPLREYTYSMDLAKAILWCLKNQEKNTLLNIGNNQKISVKELSMIIADKIGINKERIGFNGQTSFGKQIQSTDNSLFVNLSGFTYSNIHLAIDEAINDFFLNWQKA